MEATFETIKANLFAASHSAIGDWNSFPWHRDSGVIQTHKRESSQALAIDVFGSIKVSDERHRIIGAMARDCGVPDAGSWELELEWTDPDNLLCEPTPTQVDAIAFGQAALLVIECKFTEVGGRCSQPIPIGKGAHRGVRQCNGDYALQTNPVNGVTAHCALTGKGVRYWESIPKIFGLGAEQEHRPCLFKSVAYQSMRNVVLADRLASSRAVSSAVIAAYADAEGLATAKKVRSGVLGQTAASGRTLVVPFFLSINRYSRSIAVRESRRMEGTGRMGGAEDQNCSGAGHAPDEVTSGGISRANPRPQGGGHCQTCASAATFTDTMGYLSRDCTCASCTLTMEHFERELNALLDHLAQRNEPSLNHDSAIRALAHADTQS